MDKHEIIKRLKNIAGYAVHTVGEEPFVMSLDDGIAVNEAIELLKKPETNCSEIPNNSDTISRTQAIDALLGIAAMRNTIPLGSAIFNIKKLPSAQPERKTGHWILDRSGKYCCSKCMEPCATYVMMKPRDKFCKMCGAKMERGEKE